MSGNGSDTVQHDPEGSIFLFKTRHPEREFGNWYAQLLLGRGIGADKTVAEKEALYTQLCEARDRHLGTPAVATTVEL